jgi:hypothetical protein
MPDLVVVRPFPALDDRRRSNAQWQPADRGAEDALLAHEGNTPTDRRQLFLPVDDN